jgi:hypothetical protein
LLFAAALLLLPFAAAAAAPSCHEPSEVAAMRFRQLQIELWLAASKCEAGTGDYSGRYKAYVEKARPGLIDNGRALQHVFSRRGKGVAAMDKYLTAMANDAQMRSQSAADYCTVAWYRLERAAAMPAHDLDRLAAEAVPVPFRADPCPAARRR